MRHPIRTNAIRNLMMRIPMDAYVSCADVPLDYEALHRLAEADYIDLRQRKRAGKANGRLEFRRLVDWVETGEEARAAMKRCKAVNKRRARDAQLAAERAEARRLELPPRQVCIRNWCKACAKVRSLAAMVGLV